MGLDPYQVVFKICWSRLEHCLIVYAQSVGLTYLIRFDSIVCVSFCINTYIENACT